MAFTLQVHQFRRGKNNIRVLFKEVPYKAFCFGGERLYVQDGGVYSESGQEITDPPTWFWEEYAKTNPAKQKLLKLQPKGKKAA